MASVVTRKARLILRAPSPAHDKYGSLSRASGNVSHTNRVAMEKNNLIKKIQELKKEKNENEEMNLPGGGLRMLGARKIETA